MSIVQLTPDVLGYIFAEYMSYLDVVHVPTLVCKKWYAAVLACYSMWERRVIERHPCVYYSCRGYATVTTAFMQNREPVLHLQKRHWRRVLIELGKRRWLPLDDIPLQQVLESADLPSEVSGATHLPGSTTQAPLRVHVVGFSGAGKRVFLNSVARVAQLFTGKDHRVIDERRASSSHVEAFDCSFWTWECDKYSSSNLWSSFSRVKDAIVFLVNSEHVDDDEKATAALREMVQATQAGNQNIPVLVCVSQDGDSRTRVNPADAYFKMFVDRLHHPENSPAEAAASQSATKGKPSVRVQATSCSDQQHDDAVLSGIEWLRHQVGK